MVSPPAYEEEEIVNPPRISHPFTLPLAIEKELVTSQSYTFNLYEVPVIDEINEEIKFTVPPDPEQVTFPLYIPIMVTSLPVPGLKVKEPESVNCSPATAATIKSVLLVIVTFSE